MLTPEKAERAAAMLERLRADIKDDVVRRESQPFTAGNVAQALGEICAQVDALANVLIEVLSTPYLVDHAAVALTGIAGGES